MKNKIFVKFVEYMWLVMAAFCIIMGIRYTMSVGFDNAWLIFFLALISLGMFVVRRMQRKNAEKRNRKR